MRGSMPNDTTPSSAPRRWTALAGHLAAARAASLVLTASLALLASLSASCSPDRTRLGPADTDEQFTLGPATEYAVAVAAGGGVADSISGGEFVFPDGGSGTLTVARILASPLAPPEGAEGFSVEYTGDEKLELRLPRSEDSIPILWIYGFGDASPADPMPVRDTWWPVMPEDTLSNPAVFELVAPGFPDFTPIESKVGPPRGPAQLLAPAAQPSAPIHNYRFMRRYISRSNPAWMNLSNLRQMTDWTVRDVIAALPPGLQGHATAETTAPNARLAFRSYRALPAPEVSAYAAFRYYRTYIGAPIRRVYPMMSYVCSGPNLATEATVAHEVGHYFTHVFFGDNDFETLTRAQLRTNHDIGSVHSERPMLEEYAMFVDYFKNGTIRGGSDVTEPRELFMKSPGIVDYPSQEAYATCLLARLHVNDATIHDSQGDDEDIPVVNASFTDLFEILFGRAPTAANMLRAEIALYLAASGRGDRLPAILERTGWSYNGYGTVLNDQGLPVEGAEVQSVCVVGSEGGREYLAPPEPVVTDSRGRFTLPRIFPGTHTIRVTTDALTQDFPYTVDPDTRTDVARNIGPLIVRENLINQLHRTKYISLYCEGLFTKDNQSTYWDLFEHAYAVFHRGQWTGNTFTLQYSDSTETTYGRTTSEVVDLEATFSESGATLTRLRCTTNRYVRFDGELASSYTETIDIDDLPMTITNTENPENPSIYYDLYTTEIAPKIRSISAVERSHSQGSPDIVHPVVEFKWTSTEFPGHVGAVLYGQSPVDAKE